ncbi:MAG: endonuclease/exonuclease/phosphatase family protein, partial [Proteobacteria bacterium]|nr:endonuclease/exonuclease/phosphatase family protein [Pseudomonadota bacterium]
MKIVSYNVNGIKARLPRLIEYLAEQQPDIVCLQELKSSDDTFPEADIRAAGYGAVWHGQKGFNGVAVLARGADPVERQRGLEGEPEDEHSRYLECAVDGLVVASIYLPNGNPQPGPKFDYKLRWMERLARRARALLAEEVPTVLAGDYNVIPNDDDVYSTRAMADDALMQPESRAAYRALLAQGWTDALRTRHPQGRVWT